MQKFLRTLMLAAAMLLPFASQAQCGAITTFPWTENFEAMTASTVPTCWDNSASGSSTLTSNPERIWGVYSYSGNKMIRMYNYFVQSGTALINTPTFDLPTGESYSLTFSYSHRASCGAFSVKVSTDNGTTFTELQSYTSTGSNDYTNPGDFTEAEISLAAYAGQSIILQFFSTANYGSGAIFVDDIRIGAPATCFKVTDLAIDASQTTANSLTLTWTDTRNTGATYTIYNGETVVASNVSGTSYTVTGLDANTGYTFGVMTDCGGGDVTDLATVNGRTACGAISLPWTCGFEADEIVNTTQATALPWCSQRYVTPGATSGTNYPYSYAGNVRTGSRSFYYYGSTSASYPDMMAWILPELDVATYPMNANRVTFWAKMGSSSSNKYVYAYTVTDPTDITTATLVDSVQVTGTTYAKYSVSLTSAPATDAYLVLAVMKGSGSLYMDDVTLEEMPSCLDVSSVAIEAVTSSSMTLTWVANEANAAGTTYTVYDMSDTSIVASNITGTTYTVTDLDANTAYTFGVQSNCPAGDAPLTTVSGRTSCAAEALPFTENFSANLSSNPCWRGASVLYADNVEVTMGTIPTNWGYQSSVSNGIEAGHYRVNIYGTGCQYWLITPEIDLTTASNPLLTFDAAFTAYSGTAVASGFESNTSQKFMILVSINNGQTWSVASDIALSTIASLTYIPQYVNLATYAGETVRIAFYAQSTTAGGDNNLHIDNINIDESTGEICYPVSGLAASNITAAGATLSWEGTADSYNVYVIAGTDTTLVDNVSATTLVIDTLTANTSYTYGVTSVCGSDESGMVSVTFRTNCGAEALPFSEDFSATLASDPCWRGASILYADGVNVTMGANSNWTYTSSESNGIAAGHYRVNIYGTTCYKWMITPEIDLTTASNPLLTFDAAFTAYSGTAVASGFESNTSQKFMILVSANGGQTWSVASDIALSGLVSLTYIPQYVNLAAYAGETVRIAFYAQSTTSGGDNNLHIDNISIDESTGEICYPVSGLTAINVATDSARLIWEGDASSYNVYAITATDTQYVATVTDTTVLFETLTPMTNYKYGVTAVCGSDESDMVSVTFTTACAAIAIPFTEGFENGIDCWTLSACATSTGVAENTSYSTYANTGTHAFKFAYNTNPPQYLISPELTGTEAGAFVSFMYRVGGTWQESFALGYSTTTNDVTAFTWFTELTGLSNQTYELYSQILPADVKYVAIKYTANDMLALYIDDFSVTEIPSCPAVTGLTAINVATDSARLIWEGDATSYNVYAISAIDTQLVTTVTDTTVLLNTLTPMTNYTYGVTSVCGSDEGSMVVVEFATACAAIAVPFTENFETTSPTFQCWTVDGVASTGLSNDAFLFYYSTNPPQYLVSPELSGVTDGLTVSFLYKAYSNYFPESFQLGYSTTTNAYADFTWFAEVNNITSTSYTEYSQILPGAVKYVAVKYTANDQYGLYIDSMVFAEPPACMPVTDLTVDSVTTTSVFLSWTGTAAAYNIYSATGDVVATGVTTTNYEVTGLTASTNYTFGVASVCGSDQSDVVTVPARTDCAGGSCTIKIYAEDEYGDGWADEYGAAYSNITISQNGATVATYSMQTTSYDTFSVNVCSGMPVSFTWNSNSDYDFEASFKILDGNDTVLISVSDASMLTDGAVFLTVNDACGNNTPIQILDSVKVTVAVNNATMGTTVPAPGVHYFYEGDVASVVAQPAAGYHLEGWTIRVTMDYSSYGYDTVVAIIDTTLNIAEVDVFTLIGYDTVEAGDHVYEFFVTANFAAGAAEPDTVTLIVNVPDPTRGTTTPAPGTHYFTTGQTLSLTAQPATGYMLADWMFTLVNASGDTIYDAEYADTNVTDFFDIFVDLPAVGPMLDGYIFNVTPIFQGVIPTTHTVTVTSMNPQMGTVNPEGDSVVNDGSSFTATATPNAGYHFVNWVDATGNTITDNPYTFVVNSNVTLRAVFAADSVAPTTYTVTVNVNDSTMGYVLGIPTGTVEAGTVVSLTAMANSGFHFVNWSTGETTQTISITVNSDITIVANFEANPEDTYTVQVLWDDNMGNVTGIPAEPVAAGTTVTLMANPLEGYKFVAWLDSNRDTLSKESIYTIDSIADNVNLVALFDVKVGIEDVTMDNVKVYSNESVIYVLGAEGQNVYVYDLNGRVMNAAPKAGDRVEFRMNNTGVYLVKVGTAAAKRVVVTR